MRSPIRSVAVRSLRCPSDATTTDHDELYDFTTRNQRNACQFLVIAARCNAVVSHLLCVIGTIIVAFRLSSFWSLVLIITLPHAVNCVRFKVLFDGAHVCEFFVMAALWNRAGHYIFALWFLSSLFYSSPNLSGRRLDVYHTSTHGVALVRT